MATQISKEEPALRTPGEPAPVSEEQTEADLRLQHALDEARAQINDMIADIASKHGRSHKQIARHFFTNVEDKWEDDYSLLSDEDKQAVFDWLQEDLDARGTTVSHKKAPKEKDNECGTLARTYKTRVALNEELIEFNETSEIQYFLLAARSKAESTVNAEPSVHFTSTDSENAIYQMSHFKPSELATSFKAFSLDEEVEYGISPEENPVRNLIETMLCDHLYALAGDEDSRLECSEWNENIADAQGIVIDCEFAAWQDLDIHHLHVG